MLHRINVYIFCLVGFLVLLGNTAAVPGNDAIVFDLVRTPEPNAHRKRDDTVAVEQLVQRTSRLGMAVVLEGKKYILNIDTGASTSWIARDDFACYDVGRNLRSQDFCKMGPGLYEEDFTSIGDFDEAYGTLAEAASGHWAKETIGLGGFDVEDAPIAFVSSLIWKGDGLTVGIFGLGWDPDDTGGIKSTIWQQLCKKHCLPVQFTLATNRYEDGEHNAGSIAFGGTLDGQPVTPDEWVTVDAVPVPQKLDQWHIDRSELGVVHNGVTTQTEIGQVTLVDSGDPKIRLPQETFYDIIDMWDPEPWFHDDTKNWVVDCTAQGPGSVYIEIGGTRFLFPVKDNIVLQYALLDEGTCLLQLAVGNVLGLPFMRHVIVHHDLEGIKEGKGPKISFKQRVYN
ncbi:aspartic peptidase domain-containing protein [Massariosphaeria phaeospora]|uniref:Aspartic peptidase domain-containing protein n=1 Tax=Massariosphaeria phaeospora TaxID=100035 RepID=A0A7C8MCW4_9PLEO|nr:aspartic peptidase domain-containing protein [Massariosphaeria phaeospora]